MNTTEITCNEHQTTTEPVLSLPRAYPESGGARVRNATLTQSKKIFEKFGESSFQDPCTPRDYPSELSVLSQMNTVYRSVMHPLSSFLSEVLAVLSHNGRLANETSLT